MVHMKLDVLVNVCKITHTHTHIHTMLLLEEGTRIARADGGRRGISLIIYYWRKEPVSYGRMREDGVYHSLYTIGGRDPYCTGGVRRRCYYIYMYDDLVWVC